MTPDERIKLQLGELMFQVAVALSTIEELKAKVETLEKEIPSPVAEETHSQPPTD